MRTLNDIIEDLEKEYYFTPGMDLKLYSRKKLTPREKRKIRGKRPKILQKSGSGMMKRDSRNSPPIRIIRNFLPRNPPRIRTGIEDIKDEKHFMNWFESKYDFLEDLPDGVYFAQKSMGRKGFSWLFAFRIKSGSIVRNSWKKKSNGKARDRPSQYLALPYFFYERSKWEV